MKPVAIVTGASSGIGYAIANRLLAQGHKVYGLSRRRWAPGVEGDAVPIEIDLTQAAAVHQFFDQFQEPALNVLVNSAGLALGMDLFQDSDWSRAQTVLETNVTSLMQVTRRALDILLKTTSGGRSIVQLGSVAGVWPYPRGAVYCASKAAVKAFSESLRQDLLGTGVRVINIEPGMVQTEFSRVRLGDAKRAEQVYANMRPLTADDIADCIEFSLRLPEHVNVQELVVFPTDQASVRDVYREGESEQ